MAKKEIRKQQQKKKATYYNPPNRLREKVGVGGIDPLVLEEAEEYIAKNKMDILPYAEQMLHEINTVISDCRAGVISRKQAKERIVPPIMELKANGRMFRYALVSEIAGVILDFLESISDINDDAMDVVVVHQQSLNAIINNKLSGEGGKEGRALAEELYAACRRYYKKHGRSR